VEAVSPACVRCSSSILVISLHAKFLLKAAYQSINEVTDPLWCTDHPSEMIVSVITVTGE
jgi:hypothetical protein